MYTSTLETTVIVLTITYGNLMDTTKNKRMVTFYGSHTLIFIFLERRVWYVVVCTLVLRVIMV